MKREHKGWRSCWDYDGSFVLFWGAGVMGHVVFCARAKLQLRYLQIPPNFIFLSFCCFLKYILADCVSDDAETF